MHEAMVLAWLLALELRERCDVLAVYINEQVALEVAGFKADVTVVVDGGVELGVLSAEGHQCSEYTYRSSDECQHGGRNLLLMWGLREGRAEVRHNAIAVASGLREEGVSQRLDKDGSAVGLGINDGLVLHPDRISHGYYTEATGTNDQTYLVVEGKYVAQALLQPNDLEGITRLQSIRTLDQSISDLLDLAAEVRNTLQWLRRGYQ